MFPPWKPYVLSVIFPLFILSWVLCVALFIAKLAMSIFVVLMAIQNVHSVTKVLMGYCLVLQVRIY
ncbi:hypothetical protein WL1483_498 [Aeromonas schubertii]|uniref:Uncharacterized protein n=1 Tax=Aeromonas schubertii TaxID=652 RepID=A0A0S2SDY2_9GAMM|nr:hypothetical protein WL1483_498 [Aeromonas schubertii]